MADGKGIGWILAVPPEVTTEYAGTKLGEYYTNAGTMLATQLAAREQFLALYGVDLGEPRVDVPAYVGVASLGAELVLPSDHAPMLANQGRVLPDEASVLALRPADPERSAWLGRYLGIRQRLADRLGRLPGMGAGQEGPVTSAVLLRGASFFEDVLLRPRLAHHLLDVVTGTYLAFVSYVRAATGQKALGSTGIADDMAGNLSPALWPEFVLPYWQRIYDGLSDGRRSLHTELLRPAHLPLLSGLGLSHFDPGTDQYLTASDVVKGAPGLRFSWNLFTVRDMMQGTPAGIRQT
jgi:uroporphyrinogen-III decarboxylase